MFVLCFILIILYTKEKLFCVKYMFMFVLCFTFFYHLEKLKKPASIHLCKEKSNHNFSNKENESYRIMITKNGKRSENDKGCQRTIIS